MLATLAIVGRPNVGKSTLFNCLTRSRRALVADMPGVTRDRQYGFGRYQSQSFLVIDTGGFADPHHPQMAPHTDKQVWQAIDEADVILFVVDGQQGLSSADEAMAQELRQLPDKRIELVVNKADRESAEMVAAEFYALGLGDPNIIAAKSGRGIPDLLQLSLAGFSTEPEHDIEDDPNVIHIAVVGRPNVGKSTLINRVLGEERLVVSDVSGTTRDSIFVPFSYEDQSYMLIDTAGVRRKARVDNKIEKFSIIKTMQAVQRAQVVLVVMNAQERLSDQDLKMLGYVVQAGKPFVLLFNKWDHMDDYDRDQFKAAVDRRLVFAEYARRYFISALHGSGLGRLFAAIKEAHGAATQAFTTPELTKSLEKALEEHQPPVVRGRRIKLRYAHLATQDPLTLVIHGKQTDSLPGSYKRYLVNYYRKRYNLVGVPLLLEFKKDHNPYST